MDKKSAKPVTPAWVERLAQAWRPRMAHGRGRTCTGKPATCQAAIAWAIGNGAATITELVTATGRPRVEVRNAIDRGVFAGRFSRDGEAVSLREKAAADVLAAKGGGNVD